MKAPFVCVLTLVSALSCFGSERLVNGGFETFTDGAPTGWFGLLEPGVIVHSTTVSPFGEYGASTRSVYFPASPLLVDMIQGFEPFTGPMALSFDFMLDGPAATPWLITLGGLSNPAFYVGIDNGMFRVSEGESFGSTPHAVTSLTPQTWYHVSVIADPATFTYGGSIVPFGGAPISWDGLELHRYDGDTRNIVITTAEVTTPLYLDNFSVTPVPEPTTLALVVLSLCCLACARHRRKPANHREAPSPVGRERVPQGG